MAAEKPPHVLGISGSLRKASYNTALLRAAAEILPSWMMLETPDLSPLPMFNQDYEKPFPEAVTHLRARLAQADALLIAAPEYNSSLSGALKNAIGWASRAVATAEGHARWHHRSQHWQLWHAEVATASPPGTDACRRPATGQA